MDLLAHLETFAAVAAHGGVTRAAEELGLPQPLISRRIQSLERAWGIQLFERTPRGLTMMPLGEVTLPYARDIVERTRHLATVVATARTGVIQSVAVPSGCPPQALGRMIAAAGVHGLNVALCEALAVERRDGLRDGRFAAAILRTAPGDDAVTVPTGLARAPQFAGPTMGSVHLDSLAPRRGASEPDTLWLTPEDDLEPFGSVLRQACARAGLPGGMIRRVPSAATGAAEVFASGGALWCDARTAARAGLRWVPIADVSLHRGYSLASDRTAHPRLDRDALAMLGSHLATIVGAAVAGGLVDHRDDPDGDEVDAWLAARGG